MHNAHTAHCTKSDVLFISVHWNELLSLIIDLNEMRGMKERYFVQRDKKENVFEIIRSGLSSSVNRSAILTEFSSYVEYSLTNHLWQIN